MSEQRSTHQLVQLTPDMIDALSELIITDENTTCYLCESCNVVKPENWMMVEYLDEEDAGINFMCNDCYTQELEDGNIERTEVDI